MSSPYPPYANNGQYQQQPSPASQQGWQGQGQPQQYQMPQSQPYAQQQQAPMSQGKWEGQYTQDYGQKSQKLDAIKPKYVHLNFRLGLRGLEAREGGRR